MQCEPCIAGLPYFCDIAGSMWAAPSLHLCAPYTRGKVCNLLLLVQSVCLCLGAFAAAWTQVGVAWGMMDSCQATGLVEGLCQCSAAGAWTFHQPGW